MRSSVIALVVMAAVVGVLSAPINENDVIAEEDTMFVQTEPPAADNATDDKAGKVVNKKEYHYVEKGGVANFDKDPTGSFSRRRVMLGEHTEVAKAFDDMFSKYYHNPTLDIDAEEAKKMGQDKSAKAVTAKATPAAPPGKENVEVINELKPIHTMPKPDPKNPPEEYTVGGKDYEVAKVINVVKSVPAPPPVPPPPVPLKPTAPTKTHTDTAAEDPKAGDEDEDEDEEDKCTSCVTAFKAQGGCDLWKSGSDPSAAIPPECSHCGFAAASACHLDPHNKIVAKASPAAEKAIKDAEDAAKKAVKQAKKQAEQHAKKKPTKQGVTIDHAAPNHDGGTSIGEPITLPPIDMGHEPISERRNGGKPPLSHTPAKPPVPKEEPKPVPKTPPAIPEPAEPEDQVFGAGLKEPKEGVWAGGNSDWAISAPWTTNKGSPFGAPGGGKTAPAQPAAANPAAKFLPVPAEVMVEEIPAAVHKVAKPEAGPETDADADAKAPFEADADEAPWEQEQEHKKETAALVQMAARSCAARKAAQRSACNKAKVKAQSGTAKAAASKLCQSTMQKTLKACFEDWKAAKRAN